MGDPHPVRQRRKEARPAELTAAALQLFVEKGFAATRLDDVAALAGVSKGTLYLYFDGKEALFKAVIEEGILPVLDAGDDLVEHFEGSAPDLLREVIKAWWELIGNTPLGGVPKLMISEAGNFPALAQYYSEKVIVRGRELMRRVIQRGVDAGQFRPVNVDMAIDLIFSPVLMMAIWKHSLGQCGCANHEPQPYLDAHLDLVLSGLMTARDAPQPFTVAVPGDVR